MDSRVMFYLINRRGRYTMKDIKGIERNTNLQKRFVYLYNSYYNAIWRISIFR